MLSEQKFRKFENYFAAEHENSFELIGGVGTVIISAPHSVEQTRGGIIKYAEPQTGALALCLNDDIGCPVIYKTKNCGDDANYDKVSTYRQALAEYIKGNGILYLIDLHLLSPRRTALINIGTAGMKNVSDAESVGIVCSAFAERGLSVSIDRPFSGGYVNTVSSAMHRQCGITCMQIEINSKLVYGCAFSTIQSVYDALKEAVVALRG